MSFVYAGELGGLDVLSGRSAALSFHISPFMLRFHFALAMEIFRMLVASLLHRRGYYHG